MPRTATTISNHNLWGQSKIGGNQYLSATTKAETLENATFQKGAKSTWKPTSSPWKGCAHRNYTTGQLNTWRWHNKLLLSIPHHTDIPTSPVILQWQWRLFQIFKWLFVSGLIIPWYKYLKNFKNKSWKLQRFELFNYKNYFVLLADQSVGSSKANPPPPWNTSKLRIFSETLAKHFTKFEDVKLHLHYSISPQPCKIIIAPFAGLKMSYSQHCDIRRKPRTDAQQIRLTFTYICYHASQRLT